MAAIAVLFLLCAHVDNHAVTAEPAHAVRTFYDISDRFFTFFRFRAGQVDIVRRVNTHPYAVYLRFLRNAPGCLLPQRNSAAEGILMRVQAARLQP